MTSEALELARTGDDGSAQAQAHNVLGVIARSEGDADVAFEHLGRSLELARELGDGRAETAALNNLALVERDAGTLSAALDLTTRALTVCANYGDRHREAALQSNLATCITPRPRGRGHDASEARREHAHAGNWKLVSW